MSNMQQPQIPSWYVFYMSPRCAQNKPSARPDPQHSHRIIIAVHPALPQTTSLPNKNSESNNFLKMTADITALEGRVLALEKKRYKCPKSIPVDESMRRARAHVERLGLYSANWKWVPEPYYDWKLEQRAKLLGASSTHMLCKSLLLENKKIADKPELECKKTNPRYMLVVIQYETSLDVKKLTTSLRKLRPVADRLDESFYDLRVASSEDNGRITGYEFNSVTPFGLMEDVMIILSKEIVPYSYFWMGGGHIHLKLGMSVSDFGKMGNVQTMELSEPRRSED